MQGKAAFPQADAVARRLAELGPRARKRWSDDFARAGLAYPPSSIVLAVFKEEKRLEVYGAPLGGRAVFLRSIGVTAASGGPGPKLREGDEQVPEGIYRVPLLNPHSRFHVALRVDYPNDFDRRMARREGRTNLGGDIMIHGSDRSTGCVAVGDEAAEDLFVLAADSGPGSVQVVIAPRDFRRTGEARPGPGEPAWVARLYTTLAARLRSLPPPRS